MNTSHRPRSSFFGVAGSIIGLLALIAVTLPQWVLPKVFPPQATEQITVDASLRLRDRIVMKLKGLSHHKENVEKSELDKWSELFMIAAISLALLAISFSVFSVLRHEHRLFSGVAAALGATAIAFQISILAIGAAMAIVTMYVVSNYIEEISYIAIMMASFLAIVLSVVLIPGVTTFLGVGAIAGQLTIIVICVMVVVVILSFFDLF